MKLRHLRRALFWLPLLGLAGCAVVEYQPYPPGDSRFAQCWRERAAQLPQLEAQGRRYAHATVGSGWFVLPLDYELTGQPTASPYPDDEVCFDGVYSDCWQQYSLAPLQELRDWLGERGIDLVVLLYPDPWEIAARVLNPEFAATPTHSSRAAAVLQAGGLSVIDPAPELVRRAPDYALSFYYDLYNDVHPETGAADVAADLTAANLAHYRFPNDPTQHFALEYAPSPAARRHPLTGADISIEHVTVNGQTPTLRSPTSPVLVIGNSISATPYAGEFAARLGRYLGFMPDYIRNDGDGIATGVPRRLQLQPEDYLTGKRVVVLVLSYPQLFYRWQSIRRIGELTAAANGEPLTVTGDLRLQPAADNWWAELARDWRSADRFTEAEAGFVRLQRRRDAAIRFQKTGAAASVVQVVAPALREARVVKVTIVTTAPPGYLQVRLGDYTTTLNDYQETLYLPGAADADRLELTATLPEQVIGVGDLTLYR